MAEMLHRVNRRMDRLLNRGDLIQLFLLTLFLFLFSNLRSENDQTLQFSPRSLPPFLSDKNKKWKPWSKFSQKLTTFFRIKFLCIFRVGGGGQTKRENEGQGGKKGMNTYISQFYLNAGNKNKPWKQCIISRVNSDKRLNGDLFLKLLFIACNLYC